jgi:long-chain acyl-CoA synthetase
MVSGSAALQPRLTRILRPEFHNGRIWFKETSPVISVNDVRNGGFRVELLEEY